MPPSHPAALQPWHPSTASLHLPPSTHLPEAAVAAVADAALEHQVVALVRPHVGEPLQGGVGLKLGNGQGERVTG